MVLVTSILTVLLVLGSVLYQVPVKPDRAVGGTACAEAEITRAPIRLEMESALKSFIHRSFALLIAEMFEKSADADRLKQAVRTGKISGAAKDLK
jgi:hypothetical protein